MSGTQTTEQATAVELDQKYFQPLGFEGTFGRVYNLLVGRWFLFLVINTTAYLIMIGSALLLFFFIAGDMMHSYVNGSTVGSEVFVAIAVELVVYYAVMCIADGATIRAVAEIYAGKTPSIWGCIQASARKVISLLGSSIALGFLILLPALPLAWWIVAAYREHLGLVIVAYLLFIAYAIGLTIYTYVMYAAVIVENESPIGSLSRSISLVKDNFWEVFCVLFVFGIAKGLINLLVSSLTGGSHGYSAHNRLLSYYDQGMYDNNEFDMDVYSSYNGNTDYYDSQQALYDQYSNGGYNNGSVNVDFNMGGPGDGILKLVIGILFATLGSIFQAVIYLNLVVKKEGWTSANVAERLGLEASGDYGMIDERKDNVMV